LSPRRGPHKIIFIKQCCNCHNMLLHAQNQEKIDANFSKISKSHQIDQQ
jgi:hypothetical protein